MTNQDYLIRNAFNRIIGTIYGNSSDMVRWIKEHYNYYPFGLTFEKCDAETASQISEEIRQRKEKAERLTEILKIKIA